MLPVDDVRIRTSKEAACCSECKARSSEGCVAFVLDKDNGLCHLRSQIDPRAADRPLFMGLVDDGGSLLES